MSWLSRIFLSTEERRQARENARTYRHIQSLPLEIQKDIGWPDGNEARRIRNLAGLP